MNGSITGGVGIEAGESHLKVWSALPNPDGFLGEIAMFWASHEKGFKGQR